MTSATRRSTGAMPFWSSQRPNTLARWTSQFQIQSIQPLVFRLLLLDVRPDHSLISSDRRHKVPSCPKVLSYKAPFALSIDSRQVDRTLPFYEPDHLRHRVFGRDRDQHMHVIAHQMSLLNPALLLFCQSPEHFPQILSQLNIQRLAPTFGNEHHVVFALPLWSKNPICMKAKDDAEIGPGDS